jgi:hypothetical protein
LGVESIVELWVLVKDKISGHFDEKEEMRPKNY